MPDLTPSLKEALRQALLDRLKARGLSDLNLEQEYLDRLCDSVGDDLDTEVDGIIEDLERLKRTEEEEIPIPAEEPEEEEFFQRLSLNLRLQHFIMLSSVLSLIITGLPLKFHEAALSHAIIEFFGGIENSSIIHRVAATALIFVGVYHLLYTLLARQGRKDFLSLLPGLQDLRDYLQQIRYFLGKTSQKARFGRFSYIEKFDYWAVYWGMVIMIGSGSLLWFEGTALKILPKFVLDIAKEAHSDEALLATLAIIIWHFYNVHLNPHKFPMSKTWITGKISKHEMLEEHGLEYDELMRRRVVENTAQSETPLPSEASSEETT